jgi:hypothetical protein
VATGTRRPESGGAVEPTAGAPVVIGCRLVIGARLVIDYRFAIDSRGG